jgi:hypothetical protein
MPLKLTRIIIRDPTTHIIITDKIYNSKTDFIKNVHNDELVKLKLIDRPSRKWLHDHNFDNEVEYNKFSEFIHIGNVNSV